MFGYATTIRSLSQGRATFTCVFLRSNLPLAMIFYL